MGLRLEPSSRKPNRISRKVHLFSAINAGGLQEIRAMSFELCSRSSSIVLSIEFDAEVRHRYYSDRATNLYFSILKRVDPEADTAATADVMLHNISARTPNLAGFRDRPVSAQIRSKHSSLGIGARTRLGMGCGVVGMLDLDLGLQTFKFRGVLWSIALSGSTAVLFLSWMAGCIRCDDSDHEVACLIAASWALRQVQRSSSLSLSAFLQARVLEW